jgi:hypothetical protein
MPHGSALGPSECASGDDMPARITFGGERRLAIFSTGYWSTFQIPTALPLSNLRNRVGPCHKRGRFGCLLLVLPICGGGTVHAASKDDEGREKFPLRNSKKKRYLVDQSGKPLWYWQFKSNGPEKCHEFGRYLGGRLSKFENVLWLLGADRDPDDVTQHMLAMARGLEEIAPDQLKTCHAAAKSSVVLLHSEPWLDLNISHGYHDPHIFVSEDYKRQPSKPVFLGESGYYEAKCLGKAGATGSIHAVLST